MIKKSLKYLLKGIKETGYLFIMLPYALISRYQKKKIDIGFGPDPLINTVYHKKALEQKGYSVETFTLSPFFITNDFDIVLSETCDLSSVTGRLTAQFKLMLIPFKYKILYIYFNGGPLGKTIFLWRLEPFIYKLGNVKTVVMPYGSDVQEMSRSHNLDFKHAMTLSYPKHKMLRKKIEQKIDLWTRNADHIVSGCEWVDYMYHWDTLMLAHFSIDMTIQKKIEKTKIEGTFKILHAPNHRHLKGTDFLVSAVEELQKEGLDIELIIIERVPNEKVIELIQEVDLVADQFIIGWYAMFAIEAMKHGKPVMCYLRDDLIQLYIGAGLIEEGEIPIINTHWMSIKDSIREAYRTREDLSRIGKKSREYIIKHHSLEHVGDVFSTINKQLIGA